MLLVVAAFYLLLFAFIFGSLALWIWMIVDVATKEPAGNDKIVWLLVVLLAGFIGAIIYFFARKRPRDAEFRRLAPASRI